MNSMAQRDGSAWWLDCIMECWGEVLGHDKVDVDRHFFLSGGDSLQLTRILVRVRQRLQVDLSLQDIVEFSTPRKMAMWCQRQSVMGPTAPALADDDAAVSITVASQSQQGLWLSEVLANNVGLYNSGVLLHLHGGLDVDTLKSALSAVLQQHPSLRSALSFEAKRGLLHLRAAAAPAMELPTEPLSLAELSDAAAAMVAVPFVFDEGLLRYQLWRITDQHHALLLACHHSIFDGWSGGVLLRSLATAYNALRHDRQWSPAATDVAFLQHCLRERQMLVSRQHRQRLHWWCDQMKDFVAHPEPWRATAEQWPYRWTQHRFELSSALMHELTQCCVELDTTLFSCLALAVQQALLAVGGRHDYCVGFPVANRTDVMEEASIGCYMQMAFARLPATLAITAASLRRAHTIVSTSQANALPLATLVHALRPSPLPDGNHWFDVVLALQNYPQVEPHFDGLDCQSEPVHGAWGQYPLKLEVHHRNKQWWLEVFYAAEAVSTAVLAEVIRQFTHALQQLATVRGDERQQRITADSGSDP